MNTFSVVIITRNEAHILAQTLASLEGLSDDIIVVDSGSTDDTINIAKRFGASVIETQWLGYGPTKNLGNKAAKHDWIFSLDADESVDPQLRQNLLNTLMPTDGDTVFYILRKTFIGRHQLRFGEYTTDRQPRFFHRQHVRWNEALVHEQLIIPLSATQKKLDGFVLHYTMKDFQSYSVKLFNYAYLNAQKLFDAGKRPSMFKIYAGPMAAFFQNFIFKLGFLDGWRGYIAARLSAFYTFLKYTRLKELWEDREQH